MTHAPVLTREGHLTWGCEDMTAIADSASVTGDASAVYIGWYLNAERFSAFDAQGNGTPAWEYDFLEGGIFMLRARCFRLFPRMDNLSWAV